MLLLTVLTKFSDFSDQSHYRLNKYSLNSNNVLILNNVISFKNH